MAAGGQDDHEEQVPAPSTTQRPLPAAISCRFLPCYTSRLSGKCFRPQTEGILPRFRLDWRRARHMRPLLNILTPGRPRPLTPTRLSGCTSRFNPVTGVFSLLVDILTRTGCQRPRAYYATVSSAPLCPLDLHPYDVPDLRGLTPAGVPVNIRPRLKAHVPRKKLTPLWDRKPYQKARPPAFAHRSASG